MLRKANKEDHADKFALRGCVTNPITASNEFDVDNYTCSHFHCTGANGIRDIIYFIHKKTPCNHTGRFCYGARGRIRTSDRLVRSQVLYPAELHAQNR